MTISAAKKWIEISLAETLGVPRTREFVRVGVPCARADFLDPENVQLLSPAGEALPVQTAVLKRWHDGSIKWLLLDFPATAAAHERVVYRLVPGKEAAFSVPDPVTIATFSDHLSVSTGAAHFIVDTRILRPFKSVSVNGKEVLSGAASCVLALQGEHAVGAIEKVVLETQGVLRSVVRLEGYFGTPARPRFVCRVHFFAGSSHAMLEMTLCNPRPARHRGGLWDLGDSGSLLFEELALHFPLSNGGESRCLCSPEPGSPLVGFDGPAGEVRIYQEGSGGANWRSPVHRTRDGEVKLRFNGYEVSRGGERVSSGMRATPVVWSGGGGLGVCATMPYFWQEFPKELVVRQDLLKVGLFPGCAPDLHELQGGEQKTTCVHLDFAAPPDGLAWARSALVALPSPETCRSSGVFDDLPAGGEGEDVVDRFVTAEDLLRKREAVDEYGWRHFGDFYADHEAFYHEGDAIFVSHYNNQYDGVSGAYRKFLATADPQWGALAGDLARHVHDIDIYHTDEDREEYCRGLHWHTDHYVDAGLSTHRSHSAEHLTIKDPRFCGGGPGSEHCYTSGLLLHFFLTGDPAYRDAVVALAQWGQIALTGPRTVLAVLKKSLSYLRALRGRGKGVPPLFPRYPLTRGTGNVITAVLDAHEATGERKYLTWVEEVIRDTVHPQDDISLRNLSCVELTWSYTVLLTALAKYLEKKASLQEFDAGFAYAHASFLHYAEWMSEHEHPYLEKPEVLEYPNETWAAQDLRKSVVFHYAARYAAPVSRERFLERSRFFFETARDHLLTRPTSIFTRPVVLMLQNGWVGSRLGRVEPLPVPLEQGASVTGRPSPRLTPVAVAERIALELARALRETSLEREVAWLRARTAR